MAPSTGDARVRRLVEGFQSLMEEYNALLLRSQTLERTLHDATSQFERFVSQRGSVTKTDLCDLKVRPSTKDIEEPVKRDSANDKWWMRSDLPMSKKNLLRTRYAVDAVQGLAPEKGVGEDMGSKISSDALPNGSSSAMPSIAESPQEQDFTTPGTPSKLDCPFSSMANRRLSAHAASVVSRYRPNGTMTPRSSSSRPALANRSWMPDNSILQTNSCSTTVSNQEECGAPGYAKKSNDIEASIQGSGPLCPIRFLEKTSPEEVADYFEKHKHEVPRSHEVCVKRYQSNAESIRQLDAKYGNLVSMIQGLGETHKPMLPDPVDDRGDPTGNSAEAERVRQWASNVSNAPEDTMQDDEEERKPRFDRPLKDVRVGESPSRPWGIQVPVTAIEAHKETMSKARDASAVPQQTSQSVQQAAVTDTAVTTKPTGRCPFAHNAPPGMINPHATEGVNAKEAATNAKQSPPVFISTPGQDVKGSTTGQDVKGSTTGQDVKGSTTGPMTFTGPVFIGYSAEQAVEVLKGLGKASI